MECRKSGNSQNSNKQRHEIPLKGQTIQSLHICLNMNQTEHKFGFVKPPNTVLLAYEPQKNRGSILGQLTKSHLHSRYSTADTGTKAVSD